MADEVVAEVPPVAWRYHSRGSMYEWHTHKWRGKTCMALRLRSKNFGADARAALRSSGIPKTAFRDEAHAQRACRRCTLRLPQQCNVCCSVCALPGRQSDHHYPRTNTAHTRGQCL